ncbi:hypothetical protein ACFL5X_02665 [Candidatus Omnitrophota bacterium]
MLGRYQILLNDWLADYFKFVADELDISFSEMVRLALCLHMLQVSPIAFPKHKIDIDWKLFENLVKNRQNISGNMDIEKFHGFISKLYFEARKASETWIEADKKKGTKPVK